MIRNICGLFLLLTLVSCDEHSTKKYFYESKNYPDFTIVELEWDGIELTKEIVKHHGIAKQRNQKLFLQMTAQWCSPCKRLRKKTEEAPLMKAYSGTYIIRLDYDEWKIDLNSIGLTKVTVPSFWELGQDNVATNYSIDGNYWKEITAEAMAPILTHYFSGEARKFIEENKLEQSK